MPLKIRVEGGASERPLCDDCKECLHRRDGMQEELFCHGFSDDPRPLRRKYTECSRYASRASDNSRALRRDVSNAPSAYVLVGRDGELRWLSPADRLAEFKTQDPFDYRVG